MPCVRGSLIPPGSGLVAGSWVGKTGADSSARCRPEQLGGGRSGSGWLLILVVLLIAAASPLLGQETPPPQQETTESTPQSEPAETTGEADAAQSEPGGSGGAAQEGEPVPDPCSLEGAEEVHWIDWTQKHIGWTVCRAALWFDGLFGKGRVYEERDATFGWIKPILIWDGIDGFDPGLEFRAKVSLPHVDRRLHALFGRGDQRSVADESTSPEEPPPLFRSVDEQWLLGLGYTPVRGARRRFDLGAGLQLGTPTEAVVNGRFRRQWFPSERVLIRLRETLFWHTEDGTGTSTRLDLERLIGPQFLIRWRVGGRVAEHTDGVQWLAETVLYQQLGEKQAFAYQLRASRENPSEVGAPRYDLDVTYRRRFRRQWLFYELRPGLSWRRPEGELERELAPVLGVAIELQFGNLPR